MAVAVLVRLKHVSTPPNERLSKELQVSSMMTFNDKMLTKCFQGEIAGIYNSTILMSKTPVPPHVLVGLFCLHNGLET